MGNRTFVYSLKLLLAFVVTTILTAGWMSSAKDEGHDGGSGGNGQIGNQPLVAMGLTPCVDGMAGTFPCRNVDMASFLPFSDIGGGSGNDVWGWTDLSSGKEYALMGRSSGTSFVDISDPEHPVYLGNLPTHTVNSTWRGIKVYANHAFIVSEARDHGMQVFDLTQLRNVTSPPSIFSETAHYSGFSNAHTLAINEESGFAYAAGTNTCAGGLHMIDIRTPTFPTFAGCFSTDGYTHETQCVIYRGPDIEHQGKEVCFSSNEDTLTIVDVTNKGAPFQLSRTPYAYSAYTHQGWLTEDQSNFLVDDELDERTFGCNTRTHIFNVSDLDAPSPSGFYEGTSTAIDHNLYVRGIYAYEANYRSGLRILDFSNIAAASLSEVAFFDVYPVDDAPEYNGAWSNYPFFASGIVVVSGIEQGLFVLRPGNPLPSPTPTPTATPTPTPVPIPAAPSNLKASAISASVINLTWTDNSVNEDGFRIERCSGGPSCNFVQIAALGPNVGTYQDSGLTRSTMYRYRVRAYNAAGSSAYSNTANARTSK
ncbi:MAG: choice-of-anchor B family protein [Pyrinomonadaceae bacterium]